MSMLSYQHECIGDLFIFMKLLHLLVSSVRFVRTFFVLLALLFHTVGTGTYVEGRLSPIYLLVGESNQGDPMLLWCKTLELITYWFVQQNLSRGSGKLYDMFLPLPIAEGCWYI